jgi:hypothetical protein
MKMRRIAALTVVVLLSAGFVSAGPIVPQDIGADAKWFGHVNFEAIHSMKLVQDLKGQCPAHEHWQAKMKELSEKLGMNPMEDVLGVTLYSNRYGGQIGVGLVYVKNLDRQKMLAMLKEKHPDHKTSEYGNRTLYTWTVKHHGKKMELTGTFASDTLIAIGADAEMVKAALDVLDQKKPGLAKDAPLLQGIPETALFASRGIDVPEEYRKTTKCPVLHNCKAATAFWTEKDGQIEGKYEFTTVSEATAKNFKTVVDGFKAMGELRFSDVPAVKKMMDGLTVEAQGESFTATYKASTEDIEAAAKAMMEQKMECPFFGKQHGPKEKHGGEKK